MPDVSTAVAGVKLRNPTMLASGFLDETAGSLARVAKAGAGGVVTKSIGSEPRTAYANPTVFEVEGGLMNAVGLANPGIEEYGGVMTGARKAGVPVVGSVFGGTPQEFALLAKKMEEYGAAAVELNLSCPHVEGVGTEVGTDPELVEAITGAVRDAVRLPVFPKLTPNVTSMAVLAEAAERGGASGLVAINTVRAMAIAPEVRRPILGHGIGGLSGPAIKPIGVRCIWELHQATDLPLVGVGGITTGRDAVEYMMAGASAVQIGTGILHRGIDVFRLVTDEVRALMEELGYGTVKDLVGVAHE